MQPLVNFARDFQVWEYVVGHRQLLIRSTKAAGLLTRVDVLFKDVAAINLPTTFAGLTVSEASERDSAHAELQLGSSTVRGEKLFMVHGSNYKGYILAAAVAWHEDEGEYNDPSYFRLRP